MGYIYFLIVTEIIRTFKKKFPSCWERKIFTMIKNIVNFSKDHIFSNIGDILKTKHIAIRVKRCSFCRYVCFSHFVSFSKRSIWLKSTFCSKKGICGRIPFRSLPQPDRTIRFCTIAKNRPRLFFFGNKKATYIGHFVSKIRSI